MACPEGFTPLGQPMSPEQVEASEALAMQTALSKYGFVLTFVEGYTLKQGEEGEIYVGPSYTPLRDEPQEPAEATHDSYWGSPRRNLCDEEYIGPRDIM